MELKLYWNRSMPTTMVELTRRNLKYFLSLFVETMLNIAQVRKRSLNLLELLILTIPFVVRHNLLYYSKLFSHVYCGLEFEITIGGEHEEHEEGEEEEEEEEHG